jgi:two-component system, OmpR family, sensor histidine kinase CiaH
VFEQIRWRIVGWSMLVLGIIVILVGGAVYLTLSRSLTTQIDQELAGRADELSKSAHELGEGTVRFDSEGYRGGFFTLAVSTDGRLLANPQQVNVPGQLSQITRNPLPRYETITLDGAATRVYVRSLSILGLPPSVLIVGQSLAFEQETLQRLVLVLIAGGAMGFILSLAGGWFLAGRALVPIELAFKRQQEFVADASHELRTPLAVLRAATELLNRRRAEPLQANEQVFDDVRQEITRMERLAGDLLMLARSDTNELELEVGEIDLGAFVADVARRVRPLAIDRGITLASHAADAPILVEGDPDRLEQVLLALLDNALKHTPSGGHVTLSVQQPGGDATVQVSDDGEGIAAEHLPRIFDRFYRIDRARSRAHGGTGLGLAIARSLVMAHGGQLTIDSDLGRGTTVTIRLRVSSQTPTLVGKLEHLAARVAHRTSEG